MIEIFLFFFSCDFGDFGFWCCDFRFFCSDFGGCCCEFAEKTMYIETKKKEKQIEK